MSFLYSHQAQEEPMIRVELGLQSGWQPWETEGDVGKVYFVPEDLPRLSRMMTVTTVGIGLL